MKRVKTQTELDSSINGINNELQTRNENLEGQGFGLKYEKIASIQLEIHKTNPLNSGSYIWLPINSQAILNIKNNDNFCAICSISAKIFPVKTNQNSTSS